MVVRHVVADEEIAHGHTAFLEDGLAPLHEISAGVGSGRVAVGGDQAADRHPRALDEQGRDGVENRSADVLEIDVDPVSNDIRN